MRRLLMTCCVALTLSLGAPALIGTADAKGQKPKGATALCNDGSYSKAHSERGACSSHGGIKTWYGPEAKSVGTAGKAPKSPAAARPRARDEQPPRSSDENAPPVSRPQRAPADAKDATAQCNDGTYSYASQHRGACSNHGGVKTWYK